MFIECSRGIDEFETLERERERERERELYLHILVIAIACQHTPWERDPFISHYVYFWHVLYMSLYKKYGSQLKLCVTHWNSLTGMKLAVTCTVKHVFIPEIHSHVSIASLLHGFIH